MDLDRLIEDIKNELFSAKDLQNDESNSEKKIIFKSPINESVYFNLGDFGAVNETHKSGHKGIDLGAPEGTYVFPIAPGKVTKTGTDSLGGNIVVMEHNVNGIPYKSYYAHLHTINCNKGDFLTQENKLGTVGQTGNAKGRANHLHLQVWENGSLINPAKLFNFKKSNLQTVSDKFSTILKQSGFTR